MSSSIYYFVLISKLLIVDIEGKLLRINKSGDLVNRNILFLSMIGKGRFEGQTRTRRTSSKLKKKLLVMVF